MELPAVDVLLGRGLVFGGVAIAGAVVGAKASARVSDPVLLAAFAALMLLVGGLGALQQAAVLGSVPFTFVLVGVAYCWIKALREETRPVLDPPVTPARTGSHAGAQTVPSTVA